MSLLVLAADTAHKTPFFIFAGCFACWAVALGVVGITRPAFPHGAAGGRVVMAISVSLMAGTMLSAVLTS